MAEQNNLKMYVWEHVLTDQYDGLMVVLAHNVDEARELLTKEYDYIPYEDLEKDPDVYDTPKAVLVWGGG
jgi:hypothetical protein